MGRKRKTEETTKKGPGRKARKQPHPDAFALEKNSKNIKKSSSKLPKQIKSRLLKGMKQGKKIKLALDSDEEEFEDLKDDFDDNDDEKMKIASEDENDEDEEEDQENGKNDSDDDEEDDRHANFEEMNDDDEEDEEDEDDEKLLPVEKKSKKLEKRQKEDKRLAEEELKTNIVEAPEGLLSDKDMSLVAVKQRISEILRVLGNFKELKEEGKHRKEYLHQLRQDLCYAYGYNEFLLTKYFDLFPKDIVEFLEASEQLRPETIRTNTLKTRRKDLAKALIGRGVNVDPIPWSKVGLVVSDIKRGRDHKVTIGATTEYLSGHYMLQGASSFLPVMALAPNQGDFVLDMAAAPGGKSTYLAQLMKNSGCLIVNDVNKDRLKAVYGNLQRMGVNIASIANVDGRKIPKIMKGFDRVLLDAPCTGSGVVSRHPNVKISKDQTDIDKCSHLQKQLLLAAIDCLSCKSKNGGYVVYSTCSVLVEENEAVINYALQKRKVKVVETGLSFGVDGFVHFKQHRFHPSLKMSKRFYPHTHNLDGFYVCKLKKLAEISPANKKDTENEDKKKKGKKEKDEEEKMDYEEDEKEDDDEEKEEEVDQNDDDDDDSD